jgi:predicted chitinase
MVNSEQLKSIMPRLTPARNTAFLPFLQAAMAEFAIESPARAAAFLAQLAHESGQFQFMEELWGPTAAQKRYEPPSSLATTLGNTETGDGKRFKGRGPIQITGRANYRQFGDMLGIDLVSDPPRAAVPDVAFRIAGLFWSKKGLNELADRATDDAFREITKRINGGSNGLADRRQFYARARTVLGVGAAPVSREAAPVSRGAERSTRAAETIGEPVFERGAEAIRTVARRQRARKAPVMRKKKTRRAAAKRRATKAASKKSRGGKTTRAKSSRRKR